MWDIVKAIIYPLMGVVLNLMYGLDNCKQNHKIAWITLGSMYCFIGGMALGRWIWR